MFVHGVLFCFVLLWFGFFRFLVLLCTKKIKGGVFLSMKDRCFEEHGGHDLATQLNGVGH